MSVEFKSNKAYVEGKITDACLRALERIGLQAEGYAVDLCPVDTGDLRNSITHQVVENDDDTHAAVYIGTPKEYGIYVEMGTGMYYPGGRKEPWAYKDGKGEWHFTHGQKAQPYLKPAVADYIKTYQNIVEDELGK